MCKGGRLWVADQFKAERVVRAAGGVGRRGVEAGDEQFEGAAVARLLGFRRGRRG